MHEPTPIAGLVTQDEQPENLLEQLAAQRRTISETKTTFIALPGYDRTPPLLLAKYRVLEGPELARIGDRARTEFRSSTWDRQINASVEMFITACDGIYVDREGNGEPVPLTLNGQPILGYDESLAEALSFKGELPQPVRHRDVVFALFGNNDVMISTHAIQLNRWMGDTTIDINDEFLGNR